MTDYTELQRLAEHHLSLGHAYTVATPAAVLALIDENERLERKNANQSESIREYQDLIMGGDVSLGMLKADIRVTTGERDQLRAEVAGLKTGYEAYERVNTELKAENELARMRIKEMDLLFGRYILAMRSALIEEEHGKGPAAAMEWIYNSLAGPGELPPEGETDSQAYFDREIVAVDNGMQDVMAFHEGRRAAMGKGEQS
ncbi:hypothetical protein HBO37_28515 [Pseudomonas proteolytica]|uniref:hypothetical protein n=1 Tax=Pseudomonas proteolytica TaxID=219574 RepID=UPI0014760B02|nr:hypothetical protein [Pseudomonas proteolytica]NMZ09284.1 hypothetical protein [Pseudomonas proteolytica]